MTAILEGIARRSQKRAPMESLARTSVTRTAGIIGDFRGKPTKRQVTVLSRDSWQAVEHQLGHVIDWRVRRANLLISGIRFSAAAVGGTLSIGQLVLEITQECDPCHRMDDQIAGLQSLLSPAFTAGVCCRVICDGTISLGDEVLFTKPQQQTRLF